MTTRALERSKRVAGHKPDHPEKDEQRGNGECVASTKSGVCGKPISVPQTDPLGKKAPSEHDETGRDPDHTFHEIDIGMTRELPQRRDRRESRLST